ncbi:MAG TPA: serine/threonine-protein kinase, partial [Gemmataceae bacterium]|nr:serine/threonine-protein kinase [Gemmataceae bacterium]
MPAPASFEEFFDVVGKSGLMEKPAVEAYCQQLRQAGTFPDSIKALADMMVADGLLTGFQAEHLVAGKWRGFIIAGKYRLLAKVGAGGMGTVYLCEHVVMKRRVALKVLPPGQAEDKTVLDRFHREARAGAALDHPNIVRALDVDSENKLHFLVMEYVEGGSLQDIVKRFGPMDVERATHYIAQAACGLQHAHEAGIVHRDIKPGNLLVDRTGTVKILDMGLARFFHDDRDELTKEFETTSVLGTADYLAPEQALNSHGVDIRADIYSLGATFYFLLAGQSPFQEGNVAQKLIWHQVRDPKPIQELRPEVPAELAAVLSTMMAKNPDDRYHTPMEVAEALSPWTQNPIAPPSEEEMPQLSLAAQSDGGSRSMAPTQRTMSQMLMPVSTIGTMQREPRSGSTDFMSPIGAGSTAPRARGDTSLTPAHGVDFGSLSRIQRGGKAADTLPAKPLADPFAAAERRKRIITIAGIACGVTVLCYSGIIGWALWRNGRQTTGHPQPQPQPAVVATADLGPGFVRLFEGHKQPIASVAMSPDGRHALSASWDGTLRLWEVSSGKLVRTLTGHDKGVNGVAFDPTGKRALSASSDNSVRLWDLDNGTDIKRFKGHTDKVQAVAFSPDGRRAVSCGNDQTIIVWDMDSAKVLKRLTGHEGIVWSVAFAPDGKRIVSGGDDKSVRIWDADSGQEMRRLDGHANAVKAVGFSPDGCQVASAGNDKVINLWDVDNGQVLQKFTGHQDAVASLAFSPDARYILSAGDDKTIRMWETATGYEVQQFTGHDQGV